MDERDWLAQRFQEHRPRLRALAYRMLGSTSEADDAVQEAWIRLSRSNAGEIDNLEAWLLTVVGRVALNMLRSRKRRGEEPLDGTPAGPHRRPRRGHRPRARGAASRLRRPRAARGARDADPRRAARLRPPRHVLGSLRARSAPSSSARPRRRANSPAVDAAASALRTRPPTPTRPHSKKKSSKPSSPPRAMETSTRSSPCSIPTSWSVWTRAAGPSSRFAVP